MAVQAVKFGLDYWNFFGIWSIIMNKIVPLLLVHLTIGKRIGIQGPARFLILGFYFLFAFLPLIQAVTQDTNYRKGFIILVCSIFTFFCIGMRGVEQKYNIQLHQIKIYPLSDQLIFRLLWIINLLDYTLLMFLVPAMGVFWVLYPDFYLILLCLVCLSLSYALVTLLVSEVKLLISLYPPAGYVLSLFIIALWMALQIGGGANDPTFIHEFVSNWRIQTFVLFIFLVIIVFLYKIGILMVSKMYKISK
ncbi:MAG: hypothetical protein F4X51_06155 [Gemmatimonadetes bacterium]|nr:hypothetical protein [Gemmatimonadota bacterium]